MSPEFPLINNHERSQVSVDEERLKEVALTVLNAFQNHSDLFDPKIWGTEITPPEGPFVRLVKEYGKEIGDDRYPLHAMFFLCMTMFADNSTSQLNRVAKVSSFRNHTWLFQPEEVVKRSQEEVVATAKDYIKTSFNGEALPEWRHNAQVIIDQYSGDLRNFFLTYGNNAPEILAALDDPKQKKDGLRRFGPKLGSLFLLWVDEYGLASLNNIDRIGIPVDFQVMRLAIQTGALKIPDTPIHKAYVTDQLIPSFSRLAIEISQEKGIPPQTLSKALWFVGHHCCNKYEHEFCPLKEMCTKMISRSPLDSDGLIDPKDVGRNITRLDAAAKRKREKQIKAGQLTFLGEGAG